MIFRRIEHIDVPQTTNLFRKCIGDLLIREGIYDPMLQQQEFDRLTGIMKQSLDDGIHNFFVAEENERVLGTIALLPPGNIIEENIRTLSGILEVSCVYVDPEFQKNGVGSFMFAAILDEILRIGKKQYYLDAGFPSSQYYWLSKLGPETYLLLNYWGPGRHHRIWEMHID